jgi:hypothetical protein
VRRSTLLLCAACHQPVAATADEPAASSFVDGDTRLALENGIFYLNGRPLDGVIVTPLLDGSLKGYTSYAAGKQAGLAVTFYDTGAIRDARWYARGKANGSHRGWWPNGIPKFDFTYVDDKREGVHRQWYVTGGLYTELSFHLDSEDGMQRAFRENGKPYINYEVRNGFKYGLSKSALCVSLQDGRIRGRE